MARKFIKITENIFVNRKRKSTELELENWLFKNLHKLEAGLVGKTRQFSIPHPDFKNRKGVVDIMAEDLQGRAVIIEVKNHANGWTAQQLLQYKDFFQAKYINTVRLILIANYVTENVLVTCLEEGIEVWLNSDQ